MQTIIAIPGRPGFNALLWWFQGPKADQDQYTFSLDEAALDLGGCRIIPLDRLVSAKGADPIAARTFLLITPHADAATGAMHSLQVHCAGESSNLARSRTLPRDGSGLDLLLSSCYCHDQQRMEASAPLPYQYLYGAPPPHLRIHCGDQVYLDLSGGGTFPRKTFTGKADPYKQYLAQWYEPTFLAWLAAAPNLCLPDDHEFWNNYPSDVRLPHTPSLKGPPSPVPERMFGAFLLYQAALNADPDALLANPALFLDIDTLRSFALSDTLPVRLFLLDTRSERTKTTVRFCKTTWLEQAVDWIKTLDRPGLLVTGQSLLELGETEAELCDFKKQYGDLMQALADSPHQIALLTGDIHWSRAQWLDFGGIRHVEIVSSALARIAPPLDFSNLWISPTGTRQWQSTDGVNGSVSYQRISKITEDPRTFAMLLLRPGGSGINLKTQWYRFEVNEADQTTGPPTLVDNLPVIDKLNTVEFELK